MNIYANYRHQRPIILYINCALCAAVFFTAFLPINLRRLYIKYKSILQKRVPAVLKEKTTVQPLVLIIPPARFSIPNNVEAISQVLYIYRLGRTTPLLCVLLGLL